MKKIILVIITISLLVLAGCDYQQEAYNDKDKTDFKSGIYIKFDIVQLKNVIDEKTLKESNLSGGFFMFIGGVLGSSKEVTQKINYYYAYLKNKNGAIYFAQIPVTKVRIYEDSDEPCIVACIDNTTQSCIDVNEENKWEQYDIFNLHIPKGTIIPRIDSNFDINNLK